MVALSRNVPRKQAMEMLLTGEPISAERAREIGLVNRVVAAGTERDAAIALAEQVGAQIGAYGEDRQGSVLSPGRDEISRMPIASPLK